MDKLYFWLTSSEGQGLSLRVKSFVALIVPLLSAFGIQIVSEEVDKFIDASFVLVFGIVHFYGWVRARRNKVMGTGKFAR
jgi:hypothetical protein